MIGQFHRNLFNIIPVSNVRPIFSAHPTMPLVSQLFHIHTNGGFQTVIGITLAFHLSPDLTDFLDTIFFSNKTIYWVAALISRVIIEFLDIGNIAIQSDITHYQIGLSRPAVGNIFSQAFTHPIRNTQSHSTRDHTLDISAINHIVDDHVHQFVPDHMPEIEIRAFKRHYGAVLEKLSKSANPFV